MTPLEDGTAGDGVVIGITLLLVTADVVLASVNFAPETKLG